MSDTEAKTKPASRQKLRKQRQEGNLANAQDLTGLVAAAVGLAVFAATAWIVWEHLTANIIAIIGLIDMPFYDAVRLGLDLLGSTLFLALIPVVGACVATAFLILIIYNGGILFAIKPVLPKLTRVSFKSGFKRIYGKRGWIELAFLLVRLGAWLTFVIVTVLVFIPKLLRSTECSGQCQAEQVQPMVWLLVLGAIILLLLAAAIDMILQKRLYLDEQKMTESEVKRESRESHGSPEIRRERNRLRREDKEGGTVKPGIENATVLVFDGQGRAVAINYEPPENQIPRIVAKSRSHDQTLGLRKKATKLGVPQVLNDGVVSHGVRASLGGHLAQDAYKDFVVVMGRAFGPADGM